MELKISKDKYTLQIETILKNKSGHLYTITFTDISPQNNIIATGSWDGTVRLYTENEQLDIIYFFKEPIEGLKFSPNGKYLAVGIENEIHIYDMNSKTSVRILPKEIAIRGAVFTWSEDSTKLACVLFDHTIRVYDIIAHKEIGLIDDIPTLGGTLIDWKRDLVALGLNNGRIAIYNLNSAVFQLVATLEGHTDSVNSVIFSDNVDDLVLYSVSNDKTIRSWDLNNDFASKIIYSSDARLLSVTCKHTIAGQILIACSEFYNLVFIEEQLQFTIHLENSTYCNAAINMNADKFIRGVDDHDLAIFSIHEKRLISKLKGKNDYINYIIMINDEEILYASHDKSIHLINIKTKEETLFEGHKESISSITISNDKKYIASSSYDDTINLWDLSTRQLIRTVTSNAELPNCVLFNSKGDQIYCASGGDFSIRGFTLDGKRLFSEQIHEEYINKLISYKNGFFSIGDDSKVIYWENSKGRILVKGDSAVVSLAVSTDQELIAFGTINGTLTIIEAKNGKTKLQLKLDNSISTCTFSPDDQFLALGSHTTLLLYNFTTNELQPVASFYEPTKEIFWIPADSQTGLLSTIICISVSREAKSCKFYETKSIESITEPTKENLEDVPETPLEPLPEIQTKSEPVSIEPEVVHDQQNSEILESELKDKIVQEVKHIVNSGKEGKSISDFTTNLNNDMSSLELGSLVYKEYMETLKHLDKIQELIQSNSDINHEGFKIILNRINRLKPVINEALEEIDFILD